MIEADSERLMGDILAAKRDISMLRRIVVPQRDAVGRLARREFGIINQEMAYRFRDVYDQFARIAEDAIVFQDRVTGILDAHLASVSNRLADVSRLLAVIATLFGPLTVITGLFGMNVPLPSLGLGGTGQFWEIVGFMALACGGMYWWFRRSGWLLRRVPRLGAERSVGRITRLPEDLGEPDRGRRGRRTPGLRHQGARRERDRRRGDAASPSPTSTAARS